MTGIFSFPVANTIFPNLALLWPSPDTNGKTRSKNKVLENKDQNLAKDEGAAPKWITADHVNVILVTTYFICSYAISSNRL